MSNWMRPCVAAFGCLLLCCCGAAAQQSGASAAPEAAEPTPARIEESQPSVYYLPDKQGNLQPVLRFQYQDFMDLYKLKNQLEQRDRPPSYSLQRMTAAGAADAERAAITVQFLVLVHDDAWTRVPLRLDQGLLRGAAHYKGSGTHFLHYEGEGAGYVCWIRGKPDSQHEITLTMLVPLTVVGGETRLKLTAPRATASELQLATPISDAVGKVSEGATLLPAVAVDDNTTKFNAVGLGGDFQLAWHKPDLHAAETPVVLDAAGTVLTRLDGHSIATEATLSVRSYSAPFDRFSVRLPPEAELVAGNPTGYVVAPVDEDGSEPDHRRLVEVRLPRKTAGPVEVRLACRRHYEPLASPSWCELAGFEVQNAARQLGTVAVAASGEWQVIWGPSRDVRPIDPLPDALRKDDVVAGFEYAADSYSLSARLVPRTTRIGVDPKYVLMVDRDQVRLEGTLTYTIRGTKATSVDVAIPGWELDEVGPDNLVVVDGVTVDSAAVSIPLAQPTSGVVELQLRAHRAIAAGASSITILLPRPLTNTVGPASVTVAPADNVELTPNREAIEGLARQRIANLPEGRQEPLCYRGTGGEAAFAAGFRILDLHEAGGDAAKTTVVDRAWIQSWLTFAARQDRAVYQLTTQQNELEATLPKGAAASRAVVLVDGKRVEGRVVAEDRLLIPLPDRREPRRFAVELRYDFSGPRPPRGSMRLEFPTLGSAEGARRMYWQLVLPADEHLIANPGGFIGEFTWGWQGYFWGRQPSLDQTQLESWCGAAPQTPLPEQTNLYLFSVLGNVQQAKFHTAGRTWIVLWSSGAALLVGLLVIYIPACRHPAALLAAGVALLTVGLIAPEPTLLLAQCASLGLALTLLAGLLERGVRRKSPKSMEPSSALIELGSTHTAYHLALAARSAPTESMPAILPEPPGKTEP